MNLDITKHLLSTLDELKSVILRKIKLGPYLCPSEYMGSNTNVAFLKLAKTPGVYTGSHHPYKAVDGITFDDSV